MAGWGGARTAGDRSEWEGTQNRRVQQQPCWDLGQETLPLRNAVGSLDMMSSYERVIASCYYYTSPPPNNNPRLPGFNIRVPF